MKFAELVVVQVVGSVVNERTFSTLSFIKSKFWKRFLRACE
jgi:hypothetical protein